MTTTAMTRLTAQGLISASFLILMGLMLAWPVAAQDDLPWKKDSREEYDVYREVPQDAPQQDRYEANRSEGYDSGAPPRYVPPQAEYDRNGGYGSDSAYNRGPDVGGRVVREPAEPRGSNGDRSFDRADYDRDGGRYRDGDGSYYDRGGLPRDRIVEEEYDRRPAEEPSTFSQDEILQTGHSFFGSVSQGLAKVLEKAFREQGRPNGYILGEDAGGAFVAGLRYGEGTLYTRDAGTHKVYWQGPTIGYDFGAEGSKTMVLVYNLGSPGDIYHRFGGVQGSAYIVGGVGLQVMQRNHVTLAPIRSGVGLRLGANIGYLKYTRSPTWNPF